MVGDTSYLGYCKKMRMESQRKIFDVYSLLWVRGGWRKQADKSSSQCHREQFDIGLYIDNLESLD